MILHYPLAMAFCSSTVRLTERDMVACEIFSWDLYGTYSLPELGSSLLTLVPLLGRVHPPDSPLLFYQQQRGPILPTTKRPYIVTAVVGVFSLLRAILPEMQHYPFRR